MQLLLYLNFHSTTEVQAGLSIFLSILHFLRVGVLHGISQIQTILASDFSVLLFSMFSFISSIVELLTFKFFKNQSNTNEVIPLKPNKFGHTTPIHNRSQLKVKGTLFSKDRGPRAEGGVAF